MQGRTILVKIWIVRFKKLFGVIPKRFKFPKSDAFGDEILRLANVNMQHKDEAPYFLTLKS